MKKVVLFSVRWGSMIPLKEEDEKSIPLWIITGVWCLPFLSALAEPGVCNLITGIGNLDMVRLFGRTGLSWTLSFWWFRFPVLFYSGEW